MQVLHWIGNPELLTGALLHLVRLACGSAGIWLLFVVICRLHYKDTRPVLENGERGREQPFYPFTAASPLAAVLLCALSIELALNEPVFVGMVYHIYADIFFLCGLLLVLVKPNPSDPNKVSLDKPSIPKTMTVIFLGYRFAINGDGGHVMGLAGALCMASCLFSLYFYDLIVPPTDPAPVAAIGGRDAKVSSKLKGALRTANGLNIMAGVVASGIICSIAISQKSTLLAWIGIVGVYAFFASVVLRVTQDWVSIASAVTVIGCLTIFTGMRLETILGGSDVVVVGLLGRPVERDSVHMAVALVRDTLGRLLGAAIGDLIKRR
jgi:hypothetical protein